jgi:hypothetical protein
VQTPSGELEFDTPEQEQRFHDEQQAGESSGPAGAVAGGDELVGAASVDEPIISDIPADDQAPNIWTLPTDPEELRPALAAFGDEEDPWASTEAGRTFRSAEAAFAMGASVRPELAAALYGVLASIDELELDEGVEDPDGRPATAIRHVADGADPVTQLSLYFDPETNEYLAFDVVLLEPDPIGGGEPPILALESVLQEVELIDAMPADFDPSAFEELMEAEGLSD